MCSVLCAGKLVLHIAKQNLLPSTVVTKRCSPEGNKRRLGYKTEPRRERLCHSNTRPSRGPTLALEACSSSSSRPKRGGGARVVFAAAPQPFCVLAALAAMWCGWCACKPTCTPDFDRLVGRARDNLGAIWGEGHGQHAVAVRALLLRLQLQGSCRKHRSSQVWTKDLGVSVPTHLHPRL